jgi:hypothetical protein
VRVASEDQKRQIVITSKDLSVTCQDLSRLVSDLSRLVSGLSVTCQDLSVSDLRVCSPGPGRLFLLRPTGGSPNSHCFCFLEFIYHWHFTQNQGLSQSSRSPSYLPRSGFPQQIILIRAEKNHCSSYLCSALVSSSSASNLRFLLLENVASCAASGASLS